MDPQAAFVTEARLAALAAFGDGVASANRIERLAREFGPADAHWAVQQAELRRRAAAKFARASEMLFTRDGLEMASTAVIARYHASLFPPDAPVADLTCGIGADLIALAGRGPAVGWDTNLEHVAYANWNLAVHGLPATAQVGNCFDAAWPDHVFADPARRTAAGKVVRVDDYQPDPREIIARARHAVVKLSPMLPDRDLNHSAVAAVFVSAGRECREALWIPAEWARGRAVLAETGAFEAGDWEPTVTSEPGPYLYDFDPAAVRARVAADIAARFGMQPLATDPGYFVHDSTGWDSPWWRRYRLLAELPARPRAIQSELRRAGWRATELKQRGTGVEASKFLHEVRTSGETPVSILALKEGPRVRYWALARTDTEIAPCR